MKIKMSLLSLEQCVGLNRLNIFQDLNNLKATYTDYALNYTVNNCNIKLSENSNFYYIKDVINKKYASAINILDDGRIKMKILKPNCIGIGARLTLNYDDVKEDASNIKYISEDIFEFDFGEYIQSELLYEGNFSEFEDFFMFNYLDIPVYLTDNMLGHKFVIIKNKKFLIEPIRWMKHEKDNVAISNKILFSSVPFDTKANSEITYFDSNMKRYIDEVFSLEFMQCLNNLKTDDDINNFNKDDQTENDGEKDSCKVFKLY